MENSFPGINNHPLLQDFYKQTNRHTEFMTKVVVISMIYFFIPAFMILILAFNFYMYFFTDLGVDAFRLPVPYWYVFKCENKQWALICESEASSIKKDFSAYCNE